VTAGDDRAYVSLAEHYERLHDDVRYRFGAFLDRPMGIRGVTLAVILLPLLPVLIVADKVGSTDELSVHQELILLVMWTASVLVIYSWRFFRRQDRAERRWRARFRIEPGDVLEVAEAKRVLLDPESTEDDREGALGTLLSHGSDSVRPGDR
jgi:hypothetical protein